MKSDRYLTELGAGLRMSLPDDRSAELLAEIASHLDAAGGDPVDELGPPGELALELISNEGASTARQVKVHALSALYVVVGLTGATLLFGGSPLDLYGLVVLVVVAFIFGFGSQLWGSRIRDARRSGSSRSAVHFAPTLVFMIAMMAALAFQEEVMTPKLTDVPAARLIGVFMVLLSLVGSVTILRPLTFNPESLQTTPTGL